MYGERRWGLKGLPQLGHIGGKIGIHERVKLAKKFAAECELESVSRLRRAASHGEEGFKKLGHSFASKNQQPSEGGGDMTQFGKNRGATVDARGLISGQDDVCNPPNAEDVPPKSDSPEPTSDQDAAPSDPAVADAAMVQACSMTNEPWPSDRVSCMICCMLG